MDGSRLSADNLAGINEYKRYSPILNYRRVVPGIQYFIFRSEAEKKKWENCLIKKGFKRPLWDKEASFAIPASNRMFLGKFRPVYVKKLKEKRDNDEYQYNNLK